MCQVYNYCIQVQYIYIQYIRVSTYSIYTIYTVSLAYTHIDISDISVLANRCKSIVYINIIFNRNIVENIITCTLLNNSSDLALGRIYTYISRIRDC